MTSFSPDIVQQITRARTPQPTLWFTAKGEKLVEEAERYFFDSDFLPVLKHLENEAPAILAEYEDVVAQTDDYRPYFQDDFAFPDDTWDTIPVEVFGVKRPESARFPVLMGLLEQHPDIIGAFFSRVKPNSEVLPHCGVTNAVYRCHMGIDLPSTDPEVTGMQVGPEVTAWKKGRFFAFNDANYHATWNRSDKERVILVVDVLRPEFKRAKFYFYARILFSYFILKIDEKLKSRLLDRFLRTQTCKRLANWISVPITPVAWLFVKASEWRARRWSATAA